MTCKTESLSQTGGRVQEGKLIRSFKQSLNKYLLNAYCVPGTVRGSGNGAVSQIKPTLAPRNLGQAALYGRAMCATGREAMSALTPFYRWGNRVE